MRRLTCGLCLSFALLSAVREADAAIINSANVTIGATSYRTFQDTTTGLTWLDLDNFWDSTTTYNSLVALLSGSGFHLATLSDLTTLQASIPAIPANFASETLIAGGNYVGNPHPGADRPLMWGIYEDGNPGNGVSWSWKFNTDLLWNFTTDIIAATSALQSANPVNQDLGAWVVSDGVLQAPVPEPATLTMFGLGALGFAGAALRRRRPA